MWLELTILLFKTCFQRRLLLPVSTWMFVYECVEPDKRKHQQPGRDMETFELDQMEFGFS